MIRLGLAGLLLCACVAGGIWLHEPGEFGIVGSEDGLVAFLVLELCAGLAWAGTCWLVQRRRLPPRAALAVVLLVALGMRVAVVASPPSLSTDIYRYVWDGRVQAAGHNPYMHLPNAEVLAPLRDEDVYPHINRFDYAPTIYPPAAQAVFAAVGVAWPTVTGMKVAILAMELGSVAVLLVLLRTAGRPLYQVALYAWHPMPVWELAGNGHVDGAALLFTALAVLAAVRLRFGGVGVALALATLCKFLPLALAPALWRRWDWKAPLAGIATVAVGYALYLRAGWRVLGFLPGYAQEEGLGNGSGFFAVRLLEAAGPVPGWASRAYLLACAVALAALAVAVAFRRWPADAAARVRRVGGGALLLATVLIVALSPHYPWYMVSLVWLGCLRPSWCVAWLTISAPLLYLDQQHDRLVWPSLIYLPFALLAVRDVARAVRAARHPAVAMGTIAHGGNLGGDTLPARIARGPGGVA